MTGFTGSVGPTGDTGARGEAFEVDAFNVNIDETGTQ